MDESRTGAGAVVAEPVAGDLVGTLFAAHYPRLVRLAVLLVDDQETAEDVVMDAFAGLQRRRLWLRNPDDGFRYLRSAVLNGSRSKLRRRRTVRNTELPAPPTSVGSAEDEAMRRSREHELVAYVRGLPQRQREVVVLRYYGGLSEAEIAAELRISRGTVKAHASRAMDALAQAMEGGRR